MKRILFRADAAPHIGIGDLMSLIHLSTYFEGCGWESHFMIRGYDAGIQLTELHRLKHCEVIPARMGVDDEVKAINRYCRTHAIALLFFEITERPLSSYQGLLPEVKKVCVSFDGAILTDMDVVIDWDVAAGNFFVPAAHPATRFLLGPEYVILPQAFYTDGRIRQRHYQPTCQRILIAMGGADEFNLTGQLAATLARERPQCRLAIVIGSGYQFRDGLVELLRPHADRVTIKHNISAMLEEYLAADVAIGAGGLTASELVASRTPALLLATHAHQRARCRYFAEQGWAVYLGYRTLDRDKLLAALDSRFIPQQWPSFQTSTIVEVCDELSEIQ